MSNLELTCGECTAPVTPRMQNRPKCGAKNANAVIEPTVQSQQMNSQQNVHINLGDLNASTVSSKSKITALLLCLFLGILGIQRLYVGRTGSGILFLLFCWTGIPWIISFFDLIFIISGTFKDGEGKFIKK
jgi:TM2 domain-containing membrane protein YozV